VTGGGGQDKMGGHGGGWPEQNGRFRFRTRSENVLDLSQRARVSY